MKEPARSGLCVLRRCHVYTIGLHFLLLEGGLLFLFCHISCFSLCFQIISFFCVPIPATAVNSVRNIKTLHSCYNFCMVSLVLRRHSFNSIFYSRHFVFLFRCKHCLPAERELGECRRQCVSVAASREQNVRSHCSH